MEELGKLQEFEKTRGKLRLPLDIKPCITKLLDGSSPGATNGLNPFIIACELFRVGKNEQQLKSLLSKANVKPSKIKSSIKSALTGKYGYACPRLEELGLCIYESRFDCWWFDKIPRQSQKDWRERDFWRYGWPQKLRATESMIYLAIRQIERKRDYQAGSRLFIAYKEISKVSGVDTSTIRKGLEALQKTGLINLTVGKKRLQGSKAQATQIQRIIPLPKK